MTLTIGDRNFRFLIDAGADHTVIRKEEAPPLGSWSQDQLYLVWVDNLHHGRHHLAALN